MEQHEKKYAEWCNTPPVRDFLNGIKMHLFSALTLLMEGNQLGKYEFTCLSLFEICFFPFLT